MSSPVARCMLPKPLLTHTATLCICPTYPCGGPEPHIMTQVTGLFPPGFTYANIILALRSSQILWILLFFSCFMLRHRNVSNVLWYTQHLMEHTERSHYHIASQVLACHPLAYHWQTCFPLPYFPFMSSLKHIHLPC